MRVQARKTLLYIARAWKMPENTPSWHFWNLEIHTNKSYNDCLYKLFRDKP